MPTKTACGPSQEEIQATVQASIAETQAAIPTETYTPAPTNTPSPTDTPLPTETPEPPPIEERILGKWSGAMTNIQGDKIPATWTFMEGRVMVVNINLLGVSYGAEWYVEGNRIHIISELDPNNPTYRDVEFVSDNVIILTKEDIQETWTRVEN